MGRKEYLEKRQTMLNEAKQLINSGKIDEGNKKMDEIKALDESCLLYTSPSPRDTR